MFEWLECAPSCRQNCSAQIATAHTLLLAQQLQTQASAHPFQVDSTDAQIRLLHADTTRQKVHDRESETCICACLSYTLRPVAISMQKPCWCICAVLTRKEGHDMSNSIYKMGLLHGEKIHKQQYGIMPHCNQSSSKYCTLLLAAQEPMQNVPGAHLILSKV